MYGSGYVWLRMSAGLYLGRSVPGCRAGQRGFMVDCGVGGSLEIKLLMPGGWCGIVRSCLRAGCW